MREIHLGSGDPLSITIAADARLSKTNYVDDQIWELSVDSGDPPALALETTYGLRAQNVRLFPRFSEGHKTITSPKSFAKFPLIRRFYPNYLEISYSPFSGLEVTGEYWTARGNALAGRIRITNSSSQSRQFHFEWVSLLNPSEGDQRMTPQEMYGVPSLVGTCGDLAPVMFITGGALTVSSPYPALVFGLDLSPGKSRQFIWCQAALSTPETSIDLAREIAACNWDAEIAKLELINAGQIEIFTGNADWDKAFALTQNIALGLFLGPTPSMPHTSFVSKRHPDDGYSIRGNGSDYGLFWSGQTPLDSYFIMSLILPAVPDLAKGLLLNFLASRNEDGEIDWKPGLGGQVSNRLATPLLASLAWRIYQVNEDKDFLHQVFSPILDFLLSWFSPHHDRDGDGIPEWDHPIQAGFEDHPLFSRWHMWSQAIDITFSETPSLCAFLYQEFRVLIRIANLLDIHEKIPALEKYAENLYEAVESSWDDLYSSYLYWDRDSHNSPPQQELGTLSGSGTIHIDQDYSQPIRLVIRITAGQETTRKPQIFIHGTSPSGKHRVERISSDRVLWFPGWGTATSGQTYSAIEYIEIRGLDDEDQVTISSAGYTDHDITTLLPLWARIPSSERANKLVTNTIMNKALYWKDNGIPGCPDVHKFSADQICQAVNIPWCVLIGEGLISYGYRQETAELVNRIMSAIVQTLKHEGTFRQYYHAETGQGFGEVNSLWGLAPVGLFLETLGVRLISPWKVGLAGKNPFPWPITVKYRGLTILRNSKKTQVIFPDGQTVIVKDPEPRIISLE
jgi:hypothetical protein